MPTVSIIIAVYNCADYISQCIESALSQTYIDFEVIVIDGGSTDGTLEKLKPYLGKVKFMVQTGKGVSNARNEGIKASSGKYIAVLDADDYWLPEKLSVQVRYMEELPEMGMVFSDLYGLQEGDSISEPYFVRTGKIIIGGYIFEELLQGKFNVSTITTLTRRECFDKVGFFDESLLYAEDTEFWLRLANRYPIGFINRPLAVYRYRKKARSSEAERHYSTKIEILKKKIEENPGVFSGNRKRQDIIIGRQYFKLGYRLFAGNKLKKARKQFSRAFRYFYRPPAVFIYYIATFFPETILKALKRIKQFFRLNTLPLVPEE